MAIKSYTKGSEERVATNFRAREFDCQGTGCCNKTLIDEQLIKWLQQIRSHFGKPVYLTAYRCEKHNAATPNAATNSYHIYGRAADFHIDGVKPADIAKYAESMGIKGIGLYDTFVHIDTREAKSFWYGHGGERRTTFGGAPKKEESYTQEQFVKDVQKICGVPTTGISDENLLRKTVTLSATVNRDHALVKPVQSRLRALDYPEVGTVDGVAGAKFTSAVAHYQQDHGCRVSGVITEWDRTWHTLLGLV